MNRRAWSWLGCSEAWLSWIRLIRLRLHRLRSIHTLAHIVEEIGLSDDHPFVALILLQRFSNKKIPVLLYLARTLTALQWKRIVHVLQVGLLGVCFVVCQHVELVSDAHIDVLLRHVEDGQRTEVSLSVLVLDCYFIVVQTWLTCLQWRLRLRDYRLGYCLPFQIRASTAWNQSYFLFVFFSELVSHLLASYRTWVI